MPALFEKFGRLGEDCSVWANQVLNATRARISEKTPPTIWPHGVWHTWVTRGLKRIGQLRHGFAVADDLYEKGGLPTPDTPPIKGSPGQFNFWAMKSKNATHFVKPADDVAVWSQVVRRRTTDLVSGEIIEDISIDKDAKAKFLFRLLDHPRNIRTEFWYYELSDRDPVDGEAADDAADEGGPEVIVTGGARDFERNEVLRLTAKDPDFADLVVAHLCIQQLQLEPGTKPCDAEGLYDMVKAELVKRGVGSRQATQRADVAIREMGDYLFDKLLYRQTYDDSVQGYVSKAVVPRGGLKSFLYNGRRYRLTLRKSLMLLYHDSEMVGGHPNVVDTIAKLEQMYWWPGLGGDAQRWVNSCAICRLVKPQKGISTMERSELHEKPFRVIFIDAMGPIRPEGESGECYIFHAECPFSRWAWLHASKSDSESDWAVFLVESVFFDLAGFPVVLRSDRGAAFTGSVVKAINQLLGNNHVFGSSYRPQSQGYLEGRHQTINHTLAAYVKKYPETWPRWTKLAQWCMRATPRKDRNGKSPYEIVTGLVPQGPMDQLFKRFDSTKIIGVSDYVSGLKANLEDIHNQVKIGLNSLQSKKDAARALAPKLLYAPGTFVFLDAPPLTVARHVGHEVGVSTRLLPRRRPQVYEVLKRPSAETVVLCDPTSRSTKLGFSQPVHVSRVKTHDLCELEQTIDGTPLRLRVITNGAARDGTIIAQLATGAVKIQYDDLGDIEIADLENEEYVWL
jgi:hypothetical protein